MKMIGVIDNVKFSGPGTKNIIYKNPEIDGYKYISHLSATVCDRLGIMLKKVKPVFNGNDFYQVGDIIEYDEETNTINRLNTFRKLTEKEKHQINFIYQQNVKISKGISRFTIMTEALAKCTSLEEIKKVSQQFDSKEYSFEEKYNAKIISESIENFIKSQQRVNATDSKNKKII